MLNLQLLQQKINESRYSYRDLSQILGFSSSATIWKWVHGRNEIKAAKLAELARLLDTPVQYFFTIDCDAQSSLQGGDSI